jgi:hypothetical protein
MEMESSRARRNLGIGARIERRGPADKRKKRHGERGED